MTFLKLRLQLLELSTFLSYSQRLSLALDRALVAVERLKGRSG